MAAPKFINVLARAARFFSEVQPSVDIESIRQREVNKAFKRFYEAASHSKRNEGWRTSNSRFGKDVDSFSRQTLINRSVDGYKNNPWRKKAVEVIVTSSVGSGIRPKLSEHKELSEFWRKWADTTSCDKQGFLNFYGIQALVMRTVAIYGEALVILSLSSRRELKLQVIDGSYLEPLNAHVVNGSPGNYISDGIEYNSLDEPVAYYVWDWRPNALNPMSIRLPAQKVIHVFEKTSPSQYRGVPMGVSSFVRSRSLDMYEDAEVERMTLSSMFMMFLKRGNTVSLQAELDTVGSAAGRDYDDVMELKPGGMHFLEEGEEVTQNNPPQSTSYEPFVRMQLRGIAAGYGITYEALSNDYSNVNFSSSRMAFLEQNRHIQQLQNNVMISGFCEKLWERFVAHYIYKTSDISALDVLPKWIAPMREMIDPAKEVKAMELQIQAGLLTFEEALAGLGKDPQDVISSHEEFYKSIDKAGLVFSTDLRHQKKDNSYDVPENGIKKSKKEK